MAILYHGTPLKNIEAIAETGALYAPIIQRVRTVYANKALTRLPTMVAVARHFLDEFCVDDDQAMKAFSVCLTPHLAAAVAVAENKKNDQFGGVVFEFDLSKSVMVALIGSDRSPDVIPPTVYLPHSLPLDAVMSMYVTPSARPMRKRIAWAFRNLVVPVEFLP